MRTFPDATQISGHVQRSIRSLFATGQTPLCQFFLGKRIPYLKKRVQGILLPLYFIKPPIVLSNVGKPELETDRKQPIFTASV